LFAIVSNADEDVARKGAGRILELFAVDAREEVHDDMTWRLLRPGSQFGLDLKSFFEGELRMNLSRATLEEIATSYFWIVCETTIEEKHARLGRFNHSKLGPVRCSLSNRLPLLERLVAQGKMPITALTDAFDKARNFGDAAFNIGVDTFPRLLKEKPNVGSNDFRQCLIEAIYRVDTEHLFLSMKASIKYDRDDKRNEIKGLAKLLGKDGRARCDAAVAATAFDDVRRTAMRDHFAATASSSHIYSVQRKLISPIAVDTMIMEPRTKMARVMASKEEPLQAIGDIDADVDESANLNADRVYFQITYLRPGQKRLNAAAVGAGGYVDQKHVAVRFLQRVQGVSDRLALMPSPVECCQRRPDVNFFLDAALGDVGDLIEDMTVYKLDTLEWACKVHVDIVDARALNKLVTKMMQAGAYPGNRNIGRLSIEDAEDRVCN
jgi:hypothetical protein